MDKTNEKGKKTVIKKSSGNNSKNENKSDNLVKEMSIEDEKIILNEDDKCIINLDKNYRILGYKEKRLAMKLLHGKYNFYEKIDYKIVDGITMITPECFRLLCMLSRTEIGDKFRRFVIDKMFDFISNQKLDINYEICPIPDVHLINTDFYDNKRVFYVINIKEEQYIYGITTDISMLLSILKDTYNVIINKIWLLNEKMKGEELIGEMKKILDNDNKYPKVDKIKSCFIADNIYNLLIEMNEVIKKLNN